MQSTVTTVDVLAGAYDEAVTITDEPSTSTLTITGGPGVTVTAPAGDSIFTATNTTFSTTGKITLSDLTITGAQASGNGGGLEDSSAAVNLMNDTFSNDSASSGGALDTQGGNKIVGDTFVGDSASNDGGAISNNGNITATNDTFVDDTAGRDGGAIATDTGAVIENDTFSADGAPSGGALYNEFDATITGDIFDDGSSAGSNCVDDPINGGSGVTDVGYNAADNSDCGMSAGNHDIVNALETGTGGINLDSLADNGGPTQTMALGADSAAIDHIPISTGLCPSTDQRGFLRPDDGESACDAGAYESGSGLPVALTVVTAGGGSGTVTSSPAGIDCHSTCSRSFSVGTVVTLTATPAAGSTFAGWSGGGCSGTGDCQVTMSAAESTTATFAVMAPVTLAVVVAGGGSGTVTSSPAGIDCGSTCSAPFGEGTVVTLTATPAAGSTFAGWSGGKCSGTGPCELLLDSHTTVTAMFTRLPAPPVSLTVIQAGSGGGTVTSSPAGIDCGSSCSAVFAEGTHVTLSAVPAGQSRFEGWSGACATASTTCSVTLSADSRVTATFVALPAVSGLSVSPRTFKAAARGPSTLPLRPRTKLGTVVSYMLNRAATVRFNVERLLPGRTAQQGAHVNCVAPARHNRKDPRCTRMVMQRGSFMLNGKAGKNAFRFTGRLAGKVLPHGTYVLVASPNADGVIGGMVEIAFRLGP
jgi:Divergent InlB B-repeat domain